MNGAAAQKLDRRKKKMSGRGHEGRRRKWLVTLPYGPLPPKKRIYSVTIGKTFVVLTLGLEDDPFSWDNFCPNKPGLTLWQQKIFVENVSEKI